MNPAAATVGPRPQNAGGNPGRSWLVSAAVHGLALAAFLAYALIVPKAPPTVAVFELVTVERPKLRPLAPKTPEPPPPKPVESRPPPAPKPVAKPKKPLAPPPPEPKVARPVVPDTALPVRDVPRENANLTTTLVANLPSDTRLALWAGRVKKLVENRWNPPSGIPVTDRVKTVVSFEVARNGQIAAVQVVQGSGNVLLDDLAKRTIQRLERVPPIPENYPDDLLKVSYEFVYNAK